MCSNFDEWKIAVKPVVWMFFSLSECYFHSGESWKISYEIWMTFAATRLEHCLTDVSRWMSANRLKLNSEKTECPTPRSSLVGRSWPRQISTVCHCLQMLTWNGTTVLVWSLYACSGGTCTAKTKYSDQISTHLPQINNLFKNLTTIFWVEFNKCTY